MSDKPYRITKIGERKTFRVRRSGSVQTADDGTVTFDRPVMVDVTFEFVANKYSPPSWDERVMHLETATPIPTTWERIKGWFVETPKLPKAQVVERKP